MNSLQYKIGSILNEDTPKSELKKKVNFFIITLIILSTLEIVLETVVSLKQSYASYFILVDTSVSILFTIEYVLRIWVYRIGDKKPSKKELLTYLFSFYMLIDLFSILSFYFSMLFSYGYSFIGMMRILRLLRLMKIGRYMKSQLLVVNAIKNKGRELMLSIQMVAFLTVILSSILYHIENNTQPQNFGSIVDGFLWSVAKFIGGTGGYGNFEPITIWGQVIATVVGLLGIALFALPAGIIGAGFVEEIERVKTEDELNEKNARLVTAFHNENMAADIKHKKLLGLTDIRRRGLKLSVAEFKLMLSREDIIKIAYKGKGIKLSTKDDVPIIQAFVENTSYGTCTNRNSNITVVSSNSVVQLYLGHFTYALSEYLEANYISSEHVAATVWIPKYKYVLNANEAYNKEEKTGNIYFDQFKDDLLEVIKEKSTVISFLCSSALNGSFHVLNGGNKGENKFAETDNFYSDLNKLESFYTSFEKALVEHDKTEEKLFSIIHKHKFYGNDNKEQFLWMLRKDKEANLIQIYLSPKILESEAKDYYPIIKILGDNIKEHLL